MTKLWLAFVCHVYAGIWVTGHAMLILGIWIVVTGTWTALAIYLSVLYILSHIQFPKSEAVVNFFHPAFTEGFNGVKVVRLDLKDRHGPIMYAFHPHAIAANGFGLAMHDCVEKLRERPTIAAATTMCVFNPFFRWFINSYGCDLSTVRKSSLHGVMSKGKHIALVPGGFEEVLLMEEGRDVVYLKKRCGFIRFAIKYGYSLVPIYAFGESRMYRNACHLPGPLKRIAAKFGVPLVVPQGESWWNFMPHRPEKGLVIVFGEQLSVDIKENPTTRDVEELHAKYIAKVEEIYHKYNPYPKVPLVIL